MGCTRKLKVDWRSVRLITRAQNTRAILSRVQPLVAVPILLGSLLAACGSSSSSTPAPAKTLTAITIDPVNSSIAVGTTLQLHATGVYSNKTTKDLTDSVTWASADPAVAHVSNAAAAKGLAGGIGAGATTVTAAFKGVKGVSAFTVTQAGLTSITVEPVNPLLAKGTAVHLAAQGNFSDGTVQDLTTQVTWNSGKSSIAQVGNASATIGLVTGVSIENTPIAAALGGIQGSTAVTVTAATLTSVTITAPVDSIAKGTSLQLTATCNFSDGAAEDCTTEATWTSSNNGIAQVGNVTRTNGLVTGVGVGSTSITGAFGGTHGSAKVAVTPATLTSISITPPDASIAKGTELRLTATGNFSDGTTEDLTAQVSWTSSNNAIAQVSNVSDAIGLATGLGEGSTSITATLKGIKGSTTLTVTAATLTSITITAPVDSIA